MTAIRRATAPGTVPAASNAPAHRPSALQPQVRSASLNSRRSLREVSIKNGEDR